jgi:hypothetical protein
MTQTFVAHSPAAKGRNPVLRSRKSFLMLFFKESKCVLLELQNSCGFFGSSRLDVNILTLIILKGDTNFELKLFQIDSFLALIKILSPLRKLVKL